jgi:hypothetical protein
MKKICRLLSSKVAGLLWIPVLMISLILPLVDAQTIIEEWQTVRIPPAPEIKPVKVDVKSTALLMLDFNKHAMRNAVPVVLHLSPRFRDFLQRPGRRVCLWFIASPQKRRM